MGLTDAHTGCNPTPGNHYLKKIGTFLKAGKKVHLAEIAEKVPIFTHLLSPQTFRL